jgi:uncharacterized paraquat-inducible protein A
VISLIQCNCGESIPVQSWNSDQPLQCPRCRLQLWHIAFPSFFQASQGTGKGELLLEQESSCFYHPEKKAVIICSSCGVFLCALCDIELNNEHLCSRCIQQGKKKGKLKNLEQERTLWDDVALALSLIPLLVWPFTVITAPITLYLIVKHWRSPASILGRTKFRFLLAGFIAFAQMTGWGFLIVHLLNQ